ncbi:hypothetical protein GCM10010341_89630 [Streptomyces noursei]|nr:hypothetical protein GCM10010341_89630 [Streptomyces noursei]
MPVEAFRMGRGYVASITNRPFGIFLKGAIDFWLTEWFPPVVRGSGRPTAGVRGATEPLVGALGPLVNARGRRTCWGTGCALCDAPREVAECRAGLVRARSA